MILLRIAVELMERSADLLMKALFPAPEQEQLGPVKWIKANRAHSKLAEAIRHIRSFLDERE